MSPFLIYFTIGALGVLFQISIKVKTLKDKYRVANQKLHLSDYISDDWPAILGSFVCVAGLVFVLDEVLDLRPELTKYIKILFFFVGFTGSTIVQTLLSTANSKIMKIIDAKTNIADGVALTEKQEGLLIKNLKTNTTINGTETNKGDKN